MYNYEIGNLKIYIDYEDEDILEKMQYYKAEKQEAPDIKICLKSQNIIPIPKGNIVSDEYMKWLKKPNEEEGYYIYVLEPYFDRVMALLDVNKNWDSATITYFDNCNVELAESCKIQTAIFVNIFIGIVFRYYILHKDGVVIHSSTISWNGKGIMFTAPSGTGKSTQTKLWQNYFGKEVTLLNDDTPAVTVIDNKPQVYGTPWCGSSGINNNGSAPIAAIVILEQEKHNSIKRLSTKEALDRLMPRTFLPYFDRDLMNKALNVLEKIVFNVPIYLLKCKPDNEAVEMAYKCVK